MLAKTILETIGNTPLVELNRVGSQLACKLYGKCEFMNPGGSVKDRIGFQMVVDAEKSGRIKPGDTLIEPTSGNTGIGLALAGAVKGYRVIITMPEKMSREKQVILEALGAEIIRTPTEAAFDSPESHISVANRLEKELPNAHILDQYKNPSNPKAHYEHTASEILADLDNKVDMVVMGAGTGGTLSGVARKIKEACPKAIIVGADPYGSILAGGTEVFSYKVEGIGYDFIPEVLDRSLVDQWVKTDDRQSFQLARRLIREEGLLVGGSSGSALSAALIAATKLGPRQNCVVLLPDGVRNYMTKFVDPKWMEENGLFGPNPGNGTVQDLLKNHCRSLISIESSDTVFHAVEVMKEKGVSQIPVMSQERLVGILKEETVLFSMGSNRKLQETPIGKVMERSVPTVEFKTPLAVLQSTVMKNGFAIVVDGDKRPVQILTKIDLVDWLNQQPPT